MAIPYSVALKRLENVARDARASRISTGDYETVPLDLAAGRIAAREYASPKSTPEFDTSAMDGYAICSTLTARASPESPTIFHVQGTIAAGDDPSDVCIRSADACIEIMTGGRFPEAGPAGKLDACVRVEDTALLEPYGSKTGKYIMVIKPVARNANRRLAGNDIRKGQAIVREGDQIRASDVLPLASVGVRTMEVLKSTRIAIFSTGKEIVKCDSGVPDVNGPYLTSAARQTGATADFLGICGDDTMLLERTIRQCAEASNYDVILTSGGVSVGKFDFVPTVLERLGAEIVFHGLAIRPGHPVLFALLPSGRGKVAYFGLPGNPGASTACFRFLVVPYLRFLNSQLAEQSIPARLIQESPPKKHSHKETASKPQSLDFFRHGCLKVTPEGICVVRTSSEQSPAKLGPYIDANCWVHVEDGDEVGQLVKCYPLTAAHTEFAVAPF